MSNNKLNCVGSSLVLAIASLVAIGAMAAGISLMSSSSSLQELSNNRKQQSYYWALSGISLAKTLKDSELLAINSKVGNKETYTIGTDLFTITVGSKSGTTYPVTSLGTSSSGKPTESNFTIGPISITPVADTETPDNPNVPDINYSGASFSFSGTYTGDTAFNTADLNGGVVINGSIYHNGPGCLVLQGSRIGKIDGSSVICSNSCITIQGNVDIYGTVISQGDIRIENGDVYGDVETGGNAYLAAWNGYIYKLTGDPATGDLRYYGTVNSDGIKNVAGDLIKIISKPDICKIYSLPNHKVVSTTKTDPNYSGTYTFTGTSISDTTTYAFPSLTTGGGARTCFDLSTEGTYVNIFLTGNLNFNSSVYVKTTSTGNCFDSSNKLTQTNYTNSKFIEAAKRIYIDVNGKSTFGGDGHAWIGTLFSKGNIKTEGSFTSIGALYTNGSIDTGGGTLTYFVKSDYANKYW